MPTTGYNKNAAKKREIDSRILNLAEVPINGTVVVYDKANRRALFYKRKQSAYHQFLLREKRRGPILVRPTDVILSIDFDGRVTKGDKFGVFAVNSEAST